MLFLPATQTFVCKTDSRFAMESRFRESALCSNQPQEGGAVRFDDGFFAEVVFFYVLRLASLIPLIEFRRVSIDRTYFADLQTMNRQSEIFFPALHGANFAPQIGSYFAPRFQSAL